MGYIDWQTDRYLDEMGRAQEVEEAYRDSGQYDIDFEEWVAEQQVENPDEPCTTVEFDTSYALENYIEAWEEAQQEAYAESLVEDDWDDWRD